VLASGLTLRSGANQGCSKINSCVERRKFKVPVGLPGGQSGTQRAISILTKQLIGNFVKNCGQPIRDILK
jgi:hypothetical protein